MSIYGNSDRAILKDISNRIKRSRLEKNMTQQALADKSGLSRTTISDIELGKPFGVLSFIQILRGLEELQELENILPESGPSPLKLLEMQRKKRQRASDKRGQVKKDESEW